MAARLRASGTTRRSSTAMARSPGFSHSPRTSAIGSGPRKNSRQRAAVSPDRGKYPRSVLAHGSTEAGGRLRRPRVRGDPGADECQRLCLPEQWWEAIHPEDRAFVLQAVETKQTRGDYDEQYRIVRPDGTIRWIRDRAFPVRDVHGEVVRVAGVAEDITERRQLEAQLGQAQKMEAVGQLAGGVAHDFSNFLTVIASCSYLLLDSVREDEGARELVRQISTPENARAR